MSRDKGVHVPDALQVHVGQEELGDTGIKRSFEHGCAIGLELLVVEVRVGVYEHDREVTKPSDAERAGPPAYFWPYSFPLP